MSEEKGDLTLYTVLVDRDHLPKEIMCGLSESLYEEGLGHADFKLFLSPL